MVSVSKIGQVFTTPVNFNANQNSKVPDKAAINKLANQQAKMGCAIMGAGALAMAGTLLKSKTMRLVAAIPAAAICIVTGRNLLHNGMAIQKAVNSPESTDKTAAPKA